MVHTKRQEVPRNWPIERKGSTFIVRPFRSLEEGVPVLVVLRDMLKMAQNRKEAKKIIYNKKVTLNGKQIKNEKNAVLLFDVISLVPVKKSYKLDLDKKGKFILKEIPEKEANKKISKVQGKKVLKGKKSQLNLSDGRNFNSEIKCQINDSVIVDLDKKQLEKCLSLKKGSKVLVFAGKHAGKRGSIENINNERKMADINVSEENSEEEKVSALIKQIIIIE